MTRYKHEAEILEQHKSNNKVLKACFRGKKEIQITWVFGGHGSRGLGRQVVQLDRRDPWQSGRN